MAAREQKTDEKRKQASFANFKRSFVAGFLSGAISKYCGHPLDTIKTRMQLSKQDIGFIVHPEKPANKEVPLFRNLKGVLPRMLRKEGITGLYSGVTSPVIGTAPIVAIQFATNDTTKRMFAETDFNPFIKKFLPGWIAGSVILIFAVPMELLKVRKQGKKGADQSYPKIMKQLTKEEGVLGLYRGFWGSFWSTAPRAGIYFYAYPALQEVFAKFDSSKGEDRNRHRIIMDKLFAGGCAGMAGWAFSYPFDVVKSYIQYHPENHSFIKTILQLYKENGLAYFYRGIHVTMLRAFPVNAVAFGVFDAVSKIMKEV